MVYKQNSFLHYCGSCPFASLLAFVLLITGTGIFCGCLYYPVRVSIDQINNAFEVEYIDHEWNRILRLILIFIPVIMGSLGLVLLISGILATGATRHHVYTGFRSRITGRISTVSLTIIVYLFLLTWLLIMLAMIIPCIGLYILKYRCVETWSKPTISDWPNTAAPIACLTPGTYGLPTPRYKPDAKVCQQKFNELCTLTEQTPRVWAGFIGSIIVVMGLIHFLCCLVVNYAYIKDGEKLHNYEQVVQEEMEYARLTRAHQIESE